MAYIDPDDWWAQQQYTHRLPDGLMYAEVPEICPACGGDTSDLDKHADYHNGLYARWPEIIYEDALDCEFTDDEDCLNEHHGLSNFARS